MRTLLLAMPLLLASPALADWKVAHSVDRMTDKRTSVALLASPDDTVGIRVTCRDPELIFSPPLAYTRTTIGINYRFDDGPITPRIAPVSSDGTEVWLWLSQGAAMRAKIARAKRLRVEIFPAGQPSRFIDFNLTGAREAFAQLGCR